MEDTIEVAGTQPHVQSEPFVDPGQHVSAPPSSSVLSEPPDTNGKGPETPAEPDHLNGALEKLQDASSAINAEATTQPVANVPSNTVRVNPPGWEAAKEQVMKNITTSDQISETLHKDDSTPRRGGRGGKRTSLGTNGAADVAEVVKTEGDPSQSTPGSTSRGRGRGRGGGRPRGKARGTGRGSKRKREGEDDDDASDSSDEVTPIATMTKSGRNIQKPTSFVPPPQSPSTNKPKRKYTRRNPQAAVCKTCLRGNSPASNMIVFCSGCDTPYHRWCHHPPIDQAVIDEVDRDWYCKHCESERVIPVSEAEVANLISVEGVSAEERQKYFSSLAPGILVTLLTKATTLHPELPVFTPDFKASIQSDASATQTANGHQVSSYARAGDVFRPPHPLPPQQPRSVSSKISSSITALGTNGTSHSDEGYTADVHPANYPRPGQGLMSTLPPETEDLQWLVEDDDRYGVFTHVYQAGQAPVTAPNNAGGVQMNV